MILYGVQGDARTCACAYQGVGVHARVHMCLGRHREVEQFSNMYASVGIPVCMHESSVNISNAKFPFTFPISHFIYIFQTFSTFCLDVNIVHILFRCLFLL